MALVEVVLVGGPLDGTRFCVDSELTRRFAFSAGPSVIYYEFRRVIFDGQFYMVGVIGQELPASEELGRLIQESRILPCSPPGPPDASPVIREDGWYWVKKEVPYQGELNDWVPALWRGEFNSWTSASFSGYPDYQIRVGARLVNPDTQQEGK